MKSKTRLIPVALTGVVLLLSACGSQPPPASDFGKEVVDHVAETQDLSEETKTCMYGVIDDFSVPEAAKSAGAGADLDEVSANADKGNEDAKKLMDQFEKDLAACN